MSNKSEATRRKARRVRLFRINKAVWLIGTRFGYAPPTIKTIEAEKELKWLARIARKAP